jgi:hypothetical protein
MQSPPSRGGATQRGSPAAFARLTTTTHLKTRKMASVLLLGRVWWREGGGGLHAGCAIPLFLNEAAPAALHPSVSHTSVATPDSAVVSCCCLLLPVCMPCSAVQWRAVLSSSPQAHTAGGREQLAANASKILGEADSQDRRLRRCRRRRTIRAQDDSGDGAQGGRKAARRCARVRISSATHSSV